MNIFESSFVTEAKVVVLTRLYRHQDSFPPWFYSRKLHHLYKKCMWFAMVYNGCITEERETLKGTRIYYSPGSLFSKLKHLLVLNNVVGSLIRLWSIISQSGSYLKPRLETHDHAGLEKYLLSWDVKLFNPIHV